MVRTVAPDEATVTVIFWFVATKIQTIWWMRGETGTIYPSLGILTVTLCIVVILSNDTAGCITRNCASVSDVRLLTAAMP